MNLSSAMKAIEKRTQKWNLRKLTTYFLVVAIITGLTTSYFAYTRLYMTPERRFWSAINNSLATPSVVRTLTQGGSGNSVVQDYRFHYAPQRVIENKVVFVERSASVNTRIQTEGVITLSEQYLRYADFESADGNNLDGILGEWATQAPLPGQEDDARLNHVSELVTLAIFGNFDARYRSNLISELQNQNVYTISFNENPELQEGEEDFITYLVSVKLKAYAGLLNQAFIDAGYGDFPPLDPEAYDESAEVASAFKVRKRDNAITAISFGGREEAYGNYGVIKDVEIPEATQTIDELQLRVEEELQ